MAKSKSFLEIQGTHLGTTHVKSNVYGDYVRAPRGTYKPAVVNEAFQKSTSRLRDANVAAKIIKDALEPFREGFKGGLFWQRLLSQFRKQLREHGTIDFSKCEEIEVNEHYPMSRFLYVDPKLTFDEATRTMNVYLGYGHHPKPKGMNYLEGYRVGVIGIFPDLEKKHAETMVVYSPVMDMKSEYAPFSLVLPVPVDATSYLICVKVEGTERGEICKNAINKGMKIEKAGRLQDF
ncbi:MAG TPA: hypothetical protein VGK59_02150 [Ohtaekwangia sp.]